MFLHQAKETLCTFKAMNDASLKNSVVPEV